MTKITAFGLLLLFFTPLWATKNQTTHIHEHQCLTAVLFFEARGESLDGKKAVAQVVINRKMDKSFPNTVCQVMLQRFQFAFVHQQPWSQIQKVMQGDLRGYNSSDRLAYYESKKTAEKALKMRLNVLPDNALFYHANYMQPKWTAKMKKVQQIGKHIFYAPKDHKK